jgi:HEAT repeat protein
MTAKQFIEEMIRLDEQIEKIKEEFSCLPPLEQEGVVIGFFEQMMGDLAENGVVSMGLIRITEMMINYDADRVSRLLVKGLGHPNPDARLLCGDALFHLSEKGFDKILPAIEVALEDGGAMAEELPFLLVEVDDPQVPQILERFLAHDNGEVVASAIEAIAEIGDPSSLAALENLRDDERQVSVDDTSFGKNWTVGRLAKEAVEMLERDGD